MWGNESINESEGGYMKNDAAGSVKKADTPKKDKTPAPVCIGMIMDHPHEEFSIWGNPVGMVQMVCIVRSFEVTSTTVSYEIEDHTGKMKAILWLEHDLKDDATIPVDKENIYVKLFGTIRNKEGEKVIMLVKINPITSIDEITCHLLEMIAARVTTEMKSKNKKIEIQTNNPGAELSSSMMSFAGGDCTEEVGMTPLQIKVYRYMKSIATGNGFTRDAIVANFPPNQKQQIQETISFLVAEGHIFSTIDHDHFQLTTA